MYDITVNRKTASTGGFPVYGYIFEQFTVDKLPVSNNDQLLPVLP